MKDGSKSNGVTLSEMSTFLEGFRKSLAHDLRTPLGTIVNYAAMLENHQGPRSEEVRSFSGRIRQKAIQTANMLQHLSTVARLAAVERRSSTADVPAVLSKVFAEIGGRGSVRQPLFEETEELLLSSDLLEYAWRTFLELESEAASAPLRNVGLNLVPDRDDVVLDLHVGGLPEAPPQAPVELATFVREAGDKVHQETVLAMRLVMDLVHLHGGKVEVSGRAGAESTLRIRQPKSA